MNTKRTIKMAILCLCLPLLLIVSLVACKETDEQNSAQPTPSTQPTAAPTPTPPPIPYIDVPETAAYYDAVVWAYEKGIASEGDTFEPLSDCTRAQVIMFLWRASGSPEPQAAEGPFSDVSSGDWYYKPALWASENGIASGTAFNPSSPCTNAEALTFLWRAEGKPMAVMDNSPVALAASGAYYARPVAWADSGGLFAQIGTAFDPDAVCSRAHLMSYLYWAEEQGAFSEEERALQTEYEQIISQQKIHDVHGTGLIYADYIDIDGSGKPGLLTVGLDMDSAAGIVATVYADIDGHAGKYCEQVLPSSTFTYLDTYQANGQLYLGVYMSHRYEGAEYQFFKVENGAFVCSDNVREISEWGTGIVGYTGTSGEDISEDEYRDTVQKYVKQKELFSQGPSWYEFGERGILPVPGIEVNGSAVKLSAAPYISYYNYKMFMVPLRDVLEAMGVAVYANSDASVILASTKSDTLAITYKDFSDWSFKDINSTYYGRDKTYKYSMNDGEFQKIAIEFTDGKVFVPLQTIVSLFGAKSEWNGKLGAMQITTNISDSNRMSQDELKKAADFDVEQAQRIAVNKGYKGPWDGVPMLGSQTDNGNGKGLAFKNGRAVWTLYTGDETEYIRDETGRLVGERTEMYRIDVASDGTIIEYPNEKAVIAAGQT